MGSIESSVLLSEAFIPALTRLGWNFIPVADTAAVVVPFALDPPGSASVLLMIEADDTRREAILHATLCVVPVARRAKAALSLAALNERYPFLSFCMSEEGEVRLLAGVDLYGVTDERLSTTAEIGLRRWAQVLFEHYAGAQRLASGRRRRPRLEREVDAVLRGMESS